MKRDAYAQADRTRTADGSRPGQYPQFRLDVLADNVDRPETFTIYPRRRPDTTTEWITCGADTCVPIGRCR